MRNPRWSDEHEDYLLKNYKIKNFSEIGRDLNFSASTISYHARRLRLKNCITKRVEDLFKLEPNGRLYIALDGLDFSWYPTQVNQAIKMWRDGLGGAEIAEKLDRDGDEVALLLIDLVRNKKIRKRIGGIYGFI